MNALHEMIGAYKSACDIHEIISAHTVLRRLLSHHFQIGGRGLRHIPNGKEMLSRLWRTPAPWKILRRASCNISPKTSPERHPRIAQVAIHNSPRHSSRVQRIERTSSIKRNKPHDGPL